MPWDSTLQKIIGGADLRPNVGDIQSATGQSSGDLGTCISVGCTNGVINKMSLVKPIHYPGKGKLSLADFRGPTDLINAGIVFGLRVPQNPSNPDPAAIHATSWDYVGYPNASALEGLHGTSPYRFYDFINPGTTPTEQSLVGYSATAKADIGGAIPASSMFYLGEPKSTAAGYSIVSVEYSPNNSEGVSIAPFVVRMSNTEEIDAATLRSRLAHCYPAILIGDYLTALTYRSGTVLSDTARPLYYNDAWTPDDWYVDMSKVLGRTNAGGTAGQSPWTSPMTELASLVLVYPATGSTYIAAGDSGTDIAQYWVYLAPDILWNASFFPIPGATGDSVALAYKTTATVANVANITKVGSLGFRVRFTFSADYSGDVAVAVTAAVSKGGSAATATKTPSYPGVSSATSYMAAFEWLGDFDILGPTGTYDVTTTIATTIGGTTSYGQGMTTIITI